MKMNVSDSESRFLGNLPPLRINMARGLPERRRVSKRWLSGSVLAGLTSLFLMGGALYAALDGRQQLTLPAQAYEKADIDSAETAQSVGKGDRPGLVANLAESDSNIMMVSTVTREGDKDIIKVRPFLYANAPLAIAPKGDLNYPPFNPLTVFAESADSEIIASASDSIYGAEVESEVSVTVIDFLATDSRIAANSNRSTDDIEQLVRRTAPGLNVGATTIASLSYIDPARFSETDSLFISSPDVTIRAENVSVLTKYNPADYEGLVFDEEIVTARAEVPFSEILKSEGMDEAEAGLIQNVLASDMSRSTAQIGDKFRLAYQARSGSDNPEAEITDRKIHRISVYRGTTHMVSVARSDDNRFVYAPEPVPLPELSVAEVKAPTVSRSRLPSAYDGIHRAALTQGLTAELTKKLVRILAFDVDFKARISPTDELSVFVSLEEGAEKPGETSEILYASVNLNNVERRYYRFRDPDTGIVDYYDEFGKSAKKFLLRQPVPNGKFRSPFGFRRHPISGIRKMHNGVDWSAPRGTPILAAGNGVVEKAGWAGGYGRQTIIRHANGYKTSYSHQNRIRKGIVPGARVRQGQVIGTVGTTGYSTGPHLHYEVIVNGNRVDPMKIRLPKGKVLQGPQLAAFEAERDRIDALLRNDNEGELELASN